MKIINLTPHALNIHTDCNGVINLPPSGDVARVSMSSKPNGFLPCNDSSVGIPLFKTSYGEVNGLPDPVDGIAYVVSGMVSASVSRADVFSPGDLIRDESGKPVGCKGLKQS